MLGVVEGSGQGSGWVTVLGQRLLSASGTGGAREGSGCEPTVGGLQAGDAHTQTQHAGGSRTSTSISVSPRPLTSLLRRVPMKPFSRAWLSFCSWPLCMDCGGGDWGAGVDGKGH